MGLCRSKYLRVRQERRRYKVKLHCAVSWASILLANLKKNAPCSLYKLFMVPTKVLSLQCTHRPIAETRKRPTRPHITYVFNWRIKVSFAHYRSKRASLNQYRQIASTWASFPICRLNLDSIAPSLPLTRLCFEQLAFAISA